MVVTAALRRVAPTFLGVLFLAVGALGVRAESAPPPTFVLAQASVAPAAPFAPATPAPQSSPAPAASPDLPAAERDDLRALLNMLGNEQERAAFTARLRALLDVGGAQAVQPAAAPDGRDDWVSGATTALGAFSGWVLDLAGELEALPAQAADLVQSLSDPLILERVAGTVVMVLAVLLAALLAEAAVKRLLAGPRRAVEARRSPNVLSRALLLVLRTILDTLPIVAFAAVAFGVLALVNLSFTVRLAVVTVVNANVLARIILAVARAVLAPNVPGLRLVALDNESATYGYLWARRFTHAGVYGYFLLRAAFALGLSARSYGVLLDLLALLLAGMAIVFILQVKAGVTYRLRGVSAPSDGVAQVRNQVADFWHLPAIAYVIAAYMVWLADAPGGFAYLARATIFSLIALALARAAQMAVRRVFGAIFRLNATTRAQFPLLEARANRYLPLLGQILEGVVMLLTVLVLLEIWGAAPFEWLASRDGQMLLGSTISIAVVLLGGLLAWEVGSAFVERLLARNPSSTRLKTLLPFLMNAFRIILLTIGGLIVLSELGVNIAPLLAGAGVLGLAIGFGAQTLVKDVITGVFILMEDTLSVGDVVEVGAHSGLVEKITIRTVHLRDFDGNLHSVPFGEVQTVKNMSKHFAFAVVDVDIAYRENIDEALAIMAEVAEDMRRTGPLADTIIAPFETVGVEGLKESAVWLRGRFKTRPLGQWNVRREFYRRIKAAFDAKGIEIPFPHQRVYLGAEKKGDAPSIKVLQGADAPPRREPKASASEAARAARTPGPVIEEHPGARERTPEDEDALLPALEK